MRTTHLLILSFLIYSYTNGQSNPANLDFERGNLSYDKLFPWYKIASPKGYYVTIDSQIVHGGHYALRIVYDTTQKNRTGGIYNNPIIDVTGKKIRMSAWYRQSNPVDSNLVSFLVSPFQGERVLIGRSFKTNGNDEWRQDSVEFNLDTIQQPIHHIRINILPKTKDTLWLDDFSIEVDGKNMYDQVPFCSAQDEIITPLNTRQIENLQILCKVWGLLKYFHPQVAAMKYNWDNELFRMIPPVKKAVNENELSSLLLHWITSLGDIPPCSYCYTNFAASVFTSNLDQSWLDDPLLSKDLRDKLRYIIANRRTGGGTYIDKDINRKVYFTNENDYNWRGIEYPNENFRLQFLFRYWNTIQYFYPYKYVIGKDWNKILTDFIPRFAEAKDTLTYHLVMAELVSSVNDSHALMYDQIVQKELAAFVLPVRISMIENKAVVTEFKNDSLANLDNWKIGDIIESIGLKSIRQIIDERMRYINGSNDPVKLAYLSSRDYLTGGKDSVVSVAIQTEKKKETRVVKRYSSIRYNQKPHQPKWKILPGNIGYVHMGLLLVKEIDSMFLELKETKAIIFDIRHYPNGTVYPLAEYLYGKRTEFVKIIYPNLDYPGTYLWENPILYGPDAQSKNKFHYTGKIIVLVNSNTQSQAEWTTMALQAVPGTITIGSQTSGADGDVERLILPGFYSAPLTGLGVFYPDKTPTQRVGVKIDITVHPTIKGIRENRDEVLEKALEVLH